MRPRLCKLEVEMDRGRVGKGKARWHEEASAKGRKNMSPLPTAQILTRTGPKRDAELVFILALARDWRE